MANQFRQLSVFSKMKLFEMHFQIFEIQNETIISENEFKI